MPLMLVEEIQAAYGCLGRAYCDVCRKVLTDCADDWAYHCAQCRFDICSECFTHHPGFSHVAVCGTWPQAVPGVWPPGSPSARDKYVLYTEKVRTPADEKPPVAEERPPPFSDCAR